MSLVYDKICEAFSGIGSSCSSMLIGYEYADLLFTFRRALLNLVENALDAMPNSGQLTLSGQCTASYLELTVQDTGVGIAAEALPRLFTPLYTTKPEGTGLGLYVVQEIVKAYGGTMDATSLPEEGTTFTIRLPLTAT